MSSSLPVGVIPNRILDWKFGGGVSCIALSIGDIVEFGLVLSAGMGYPEDDLGTGDALVKTSAPSWLVHSGCRLLCALGSREGSPSSCSDGTSSLAPAGELHAGGECASEGCARGVR